jgi:hypothetical protein
MMPPMIGACMNAHQLPDVTIVADAGMMSEANQKEIEDAGLSFIIGMRIPCVPSAVNQWHREHPGPAGRCAESMSRSPKAEQAVAGKVPVKRTQFVQLAGGTKSVNRELEAGARALPGSRAT